jgi:hypothetical protein
MKPYTLNEAWSVLKTELKQFEQYYFDAFSETIPLPNIHDVLGEWMDNYSKLSVDKQAAYDRIQQETGIFDLPVKNSACL